MRRFALVAASLALLVLPGAARADIPPMNSGGCAGKKAGVSCLTDDGKRGACNPSKCPQKSMLPDGALGFVQADCLLCYPSADTTSGGSSSGGSSGSTGAGSSSGGSASSGGSTKSGCNAAGGSSGSAAVLAVALGAFAWSRRRRT